jgi:CRP/FNR family transcriptional regulator, anaerobic regulatory protein
MNLKEQLTKRYKFSDSDWEITSQHIHPESLEAGTYFLREGNISDSMGVLTSGLVRSFIIDEEGNDITTNFFQPPNVVISIRSFNFRVPSKENIITLTNTELLTISYNDMSELWKQVPVWKQIAKDVDEMKYQDLKHRLIKFQTLSASERYKLFCRNYPEILKSVALKHVASYLGIDIATLSRIRKKK